jgi:hypothetical protein
MKTIIDPVPIDLILSELTAEKFFRKTNNGDNEIYILTAHDSPNIMREIGRLREISFRDSGGGTGLDCDIDGFDVSDSHCFMQMIVWNPFDKAIIGGYRFLYCDNLPLNTEGRVNTATSELFHFSDKFLKEYLPYTLELGRSFVQPDYQPSKNLSKGIYSLDNLWDGLCTLTQIYPEAKYFFGKVTMYPQLERESRDMILYFMQKHFPDAENLVRPRPEWNLPINMEVSKLEKIFVGETFRDDFKILNKNVRERGAFIPPLVNAYMNLSSSMRSFGTALNPTFGNVEETGILITIPDMYREKVERHMSYSKDDLPQHLRSNI